MPRLGSRRPRCGCSRTTCTPTSPSARRTSSSTAGSARPRATTRRCAAIKRELQRLGDDETLLVQSGKPVAVFETHADAPRVLIANSNLVPQWATWEHFRELDAAGLMMYGQMTAGSWIYIGTQGILQGTYETFAAVARKRFGGTLAGPPRGHRRARRHGRRAAAGGDHERAAARCASRSTCSASSAASRPATSTSAPPTSTTRCAAWTPRAAGREALSIGLLGNAAEVLPELVRRGAAVDVVTDQTSAHDPLNGYVPAGLTRRAGRRAARLATPTTTCAASARASLAHVAAIRALQARGRRGVRLRQRAARRSPPRTATRTRSPTPASSPPTSARCSARARARSAGSRCPATRPTSHATDDAILDLFGDQEHIARWIALARERVHFQGLPARICWLGYGERDRAGLRFNEMVASGELRGADRHRPRPPRRRLGRLAPARDRGDARRLGRGRRLAAAQRAGQHRLAARRGSRSTTAAASAWASIHAGQVCVADGTPEAGERIRRVADRRPRHGHRAPRRRRLAARRSRPPSALGVRMPMLDPA